MIMGSAGSVLAAVLLLPLISVILLQSDVPGYRTARADRPELVDDAPGEEVDSVLVQLEFCVADSVASELVQLSLLHPLDTLKLMHVNA